MIFIIIIIFIYLFLYLNKNYYYYIINKFYSTKKNSIFYIFIWKYY